jgi:hypothetical protein
MISNANFQFIKNILAQAGVSAAVNDSLLEERLLALLKRLKLNDVDELVWLAQLSHERHIDQEIIKAVTGFEGEGSSVPHQGVA